MFSLHHWFLLFFGGIFRFWLHLFISPTLGFLIFVSSGVFIFIPDFYCCFPGVLISPTFFPETDFCQILCFCVVVPWVLRIWEGFFYSQTFFTLHFFPYLPQYHECYGYERAFFALRRFLPCTSYRHLEQPPKASLGAGSSSRAFHSCSKRKSGLSVCLNHTLFSTAQVVVVGFYLCIKALRSYINSSYMHCNAHDKSTRSQKLLMNTGF